MGVKITYYDPSLPNGYNVGVGGLPLINNQEVELTDEQVKDYETKSGKLIEVLLSSSKFKQPQTDSKPDGVEE